MTKLYVFFVEKGVDPNIPDSNGETPLHYAIRFKNTTAIDYLINTIQVKVNSQDNAGVAPIHMASWLGDLDTVKMLCNRNDLSIDIATIHNNTAIHYAITNYHNDIIKILANRGANVNVENNNGFYPLNIAALRGDTNLIKLLISHHVKLCNFDDGVSALEFSLIRKHDSVTKILLTEYIKRNPNFKTPHSLEPHLIKDVIYRRGSDLDIVKIIRDHSSNIDNVYLAEERLKVLKERFDNANDNVLLFWAREEEPRIEISQLAQAKILRETCKHPLDLFKSHSLNYDVTSLIFSQLIPNKKIYKLSFGN